MLRRWKRPLKLIIITIKLKLGLFPWLAHNSEFAQNFKSIVQISTLTTLLLVNDVAHYTYFRVVRRPQLRTSLPSLRPQQLTLDFVTKQSH